MKPTTQQWLKYAQADLLNCERILDDDFLSNIIAFHSQQTVEKCFKALIEEHNSTIPRIHNLLRLHELIKQYLTEEIDITEIIALDNVYTASRYPGEIGMTTTGMPSLEEARELYKCAKKIYHIILQTLDLKMH